ncbi:uncharacterized protein LOC143855090 [Tasmannia lanceolata]|uniref:uncharacterized protein LOC143855090 n=1 Tax=Tasmannia lanceolata TaxID=3420 RepID=UPI0040631F5C
MRRRRRNLTRRPSQSQPHDSQTQLQDSQPQPDDSQPQPQPDDSQAQSQPHDSQPQPQDSQPQPDDSQTQPLPLPQPDDTQAQGQDSQAQLDDSQAVLGPDSQRQPDDSQDQGQDSQPQSSHVSQSQDVGSSSRRTRGPTYCKDTWGRTGRNRKRVEFNKLGQPVGKIGRKFTSFLGSLARIGDKLPIDEVDWRKVPNESKEDMWDIIQEHYHVHEMNKVWALSNLGKKWRDWKCHLKRTYFDPNLPCTEDRVIESQWSNLCNHWRSPLGQKRSETNKANRSKQLTTHTAGTKSFARIRHEEGQDLSRVEMFRRTHTKKDGRPVDSASEALMEKFLEYETQHPQSSANDIAAKDDVFAQVMGPERRGRVRMMGFGTNPTQMFGPSPNSMDYQRQIEQERNEKEKLMEEMTQFREDMTQQWQGFLSNFMRSQTTTEATSSRVDALPTSGSHPARSRPEVILMSLTRPGVEVAKGFLVSEDPTTLVDGTPMGDGFSLVSIRVIVVGDEHLIRPSVWRKTIKDAAGGHVAWPSFFVKKAPSA